MSVIIECNRCHTQTSANDEDVGLKWADLRDNNNNSNSLAREESTHLCPTCLTAFDKFMEKPS